jgi:hypothetical protein
LKAQATHPAPKALPMRPRRSVVVVAVVLRAAAVPRAVARAVPKAALKAAPKAALKAAPVPRPIADVQAAPLHFLMWRKQIPFPVFCPPEAP